MALVDVRESIQRGVSCQFQVLEICKKVDDEAESGMAAMVEFIDGRRQPLLSIDNTALHGLFMATRMHAEEILALTAQDSKGERYAQASLVRLRDALEGSQQESAQVALGCAYMQLEYLGNIAICGRGYLDESKGLTGLSSEHELMDVASEFNHAQDHATDVRDNAISLVNNANDYLQSMGMPPVEFSPNHSGDEM